MDIISFNEASTANGRIESFIENPDSMSGILTVPKVIASGETITIPAGRIAVLPNVQVDGVINIEGEVFVPSGATFGDLDAKIALKADTSYVNTQLGLKQSVLVANDPAVKTALNATGTAPIYACRAWVSFNGQGTVAISASGNVSSITDNGIGDYTINIANAIVDANFSWVGSGGYNPNACVVSGNATTYTKTATSLRISTSRLIGTSQPYVDPLDVSISIFR